MDTISALTWPGQLFQVSDTYLSQVLTQRDGLLFLYNQLGRAPRGVTLEDLSYGRGVERGESLPNRVTWIDSLGIAAKLGVTWFAMAEEGEGEGMVVAAGHVARRTDIPVGEVRVERYRKGRWQVTDVVTPGPSGPQHRHVAAGGSGIE